MIEAFCVDLQECRLSVLGDQLVHCCNGHALATLTRWRSFFVKTAPSCVQARQFVTFPEAMEHCLPGLVADGDRQYGCAGETLSEFGCKFRLRLNRYDPRPSVD